MDKLKAMRVFVSIAKEGSLTAAAKSLEKSLPSIVRMLATLEAHLHVRLFNRTTRRISLTNEGRIYLEHCSRILAEVQEAELSVSQNETELRGAMTITAPICFGEMYVSASIFRFWAQHPHVQVKLLQYDRIVNLVEEGIDVAIRLSHLVDSTLIARPIGSIRQVLCASPRFLVGLDAPLEHPEQLRKIPIVRFTGNCPDSVWHFYDDNKKVSIPANGAFVCNQVRATIDACVAGLGIGLFYSYQVMPWIEKGELKILLQEYEPAPTPLSLVYPHSRLLAARIRTLLDWLASDLDGFR